MVDDVSDCDCDTFKTLFERSETGEILSAAQNKCVESHQQQCNSCESFVAQHASLIAIAVALPQFDVAEGLTQKILQSVEMQSTPAVEASIWPVGLAAALAFFVMVPFDSVQSVLGWAVGLFGLLGLQLLMQTANSKEQLI